MGFELSVGLFLLAEMGFAMGWEVTRQEFLTTEDTGDTEDNKKSAG